MVSLAASETESLVFCSCDHLLCYPKAPVMSIARVFINSGKLPKIVDKVLTNRIF